MTLVHALRGAARSIGAQEFAETAALLETSAQNADMAAIEKQTPELLMKLHRLIDDIQAALRQQHMDEGEAYDDLAVLHLESLKSALLDMDVQSVNLLLMEYAALPLAEGMKKHISDIEQYILMFEYDLAIEYINMLLNEAQ
jgi:HPt (histidine-containing phosphotransfer) domain-containing protein